MEHGSYKAAVLQSLATPRKNKDSDIAATTTPPVWLNSAGGTTIKVWNPMYGACIATVQTQHRKTITCLLVMPPIYRQAQKQEEQPAKYKMRLLTGGLNAWLRLHSFDRETGQKQHLHGIRLNMYSSNNQTNVLGITALAATPAADCLAI
jgi:hypothetical protein